MKIVVRNEQEITRCFAQLRDIEYLGERYNSHLFGNLAVREHKNGHTNPYEFLEIKNESVAKIIDRHHYIVDFSDMVKYDTLTLSRLILLSHSFLPDEKTKMDEEHKTDDLVDIISFKKGMLTYPIPVFFDEKDLLDNGEVVFGSTTIPGYYMLRSYNNEMDLREYFEANAQELFKAVRGDKEMVSYDITPLGKELLVHFKEKKKSLFKKRITK